MVFYYWKFNTGKGDELAVNMWQAPCRPHLARLEIYNNYTECMIQERYLEYLCFISKEWATKIVSANLPKKTQDRNKYESRSSVGIIWKLAKLP